MNQCGIAEPGPEVADSSIRPREDEGADENDCDEDGPSPAMDVLGEVEDVPSPSLTIVSPSFGETAANDSGTNERMDDDRGEVEASTREDLGPKDATIATVAPDYGGEACSFGSFPSSPKII